MRGRSLTYPAMQFVSPANSYGFMDGGIDLAYSQFFGWGVREKLQYKILNSHHGELLVGQAEILKLTTSKSHFLLQHPPCGFR